MNSLPIDGSAKTDASAAVSVKLLNVDALTHRRDDGGIAFADLALSIERGSITVIGGHNGAGKTLLAMALCGHLPLERLEGSIVTAGRGGGRGAGARRAGAKGAGGTGGAKHLPLSRKRLRQYCGIVFQQAEHQVIGQTVTDDIAFGLQGGGKSAANVAIGCKAILEELSITHLADRHPLTLSGGELRNVAIGAMLAVRPHLLFLDEPFVNLDWRGVQKISRLLCDLKLGGRTIVVITHQLEHALPLADSVILLSAGKIIASGTPRSVIPACMSQELLPPGFKVSRAAAVRAACKPNKDGKSAGARGDSAGASMAAGWDAVL